jgi:chemotaxis protein methyltransferase CheR
VPRIDLSPAERANAAKQVRDETESRWYLPEVTVTPALFARFQRLIYNETGIWLSESKTALLCGRLARRLRALEFKSLREYYEVVSQPEQHEERVRMIDAITTNETRFFREPKHFEYLIGTLFPLWRRLTGQGLRSRKIRVWSAGCSSGEEPYSLAMVLAENLPACEGWDVRILATDISTRVLAIAQEGIYRIAGSTDIPRDMLQRFMLRGHSDHEGKMKVAREIRNMVEFQRLNLGDDVYPVKETFDAIFCRNVLIYFDARSKTRVVDKLVRHLAPQGLLFIGHAENLHSITQGLKSVAPTVYLQSKEKHSLREVR